MPVHAHARARTLTWARMGTQGINTKMCQIAATELGVPLEKVSWPH
jgi:CO/xanthine dehydrogenase Mo-binding subunit